MCPREKGAVRTAPLRDMHSMVGLILYYDLRYEVMVPPFYGPGAVSATETVDLEQGLRHALTTLALSWVCAVVHNRERQS